uniref:Uncharacterized protein n=1 Tax=Rhizophora mucronata TaxID=61149 RepID=A0A2P2QMS5_RHIMU
MSSARIGIPSLLRTSFIEGSGRLRLESSSSSFVCLAFWARN